MAEKKLNLVYVDGRGNAERIRFVLAGAGLDWTETYWNTKQDLIDMVASGRLVGDQVPLLETPEGIDVSQSWTVIRYIARFHGLEPEGAANIVKADAVAEIIREFEKGAGLVGYGWVDKEISKKAFQETADKWFPRFEKSVTGPYFLGEKPFYCDFVLLNSLLFVDEVLPGVVDKYPKLANIRNKLVELPSIKAFLASDKRKPQVHEEYKTLVKGIFY